MTEPKNIVIKVKYPTSGKASDYANPPSSTTEWNFKRIGLALLGLLLLIVVGINIFTPENTAPVAVSSVPVSQPDPVIETVAQPVKPEAVPAPAKTAGTGSAVVTRSQLTSGIRKNEPVDKLKLPLKIAKANELWVYYFAELKDVRGQVIYHEWWLNGNLVSRKKVNITDDSWRTASKQLITYTINNDWIVKIVDDSRNTLAEQSFNLALK